MSTLVAVLLCAAVFLFSVKRSIRGYLEKDNFFGFVWMIVALAAVGGVVVFVLKELA